MVTPSSHEPVRGFSLIEIAVVIAIVMTLLTLGLGLMSAQLSSAATSVTKKRQEAIKDALVAYLGSNRKLPCPYVPSSGSTVTGVAPTPPCAGIGIVPFATLGLGREIAQDGWGNFFSYRVYADAPAPTCPGTGWDWSNSNCFGEGKDGVTPPKTALTINDQTTPLATTGIAVIVSHGPNGLGAWAAQGTRNATPTACEEAYNAGVASPSGCPPGSNTFYKGERQDNDDVVAYLTSGEALQTLVKQGAIKSAAGKVSDDLQQLFEYAIDKNLKSSAFCTIPSPTSYSDPDGNSLRDPWGSSYTRSSNVPSGYYFSTNLTTITKTIDETTLNAYRNRAGFDPCS